jgi:C4-dicarboxylate transporter
MFTDAINVHPRVCVWLLISCLNAKISMVRSSYSVIFATYLSAMLIDCAISDFFKQTRLLMLTLFGLI